MVHTFPKGICPKVNVIVRLEFKLVYYDSTVQHFNHYTTGSPPTWWNYKKLIRFIYLSLCVNFIVHKYIQMRSIHTLIFAWLILMATCLGLFYAQRLGNPIPVVTEEFCFFCTWLYDFKYSLWTLDAIKKTCQMQWVIGTDGETVRKLFAISTIQW